MVDCKLKYWGHITIDGHFNDINIYTTLILTVTLTEFAHLTVVINFVIVVILIMYADRMLCLHYQLIPRAAHHDMSTHTRLE
jgi:hypothetical protein